jgi:hypothetical protein
MKSIKIEIKWAIIFVVTTLVWMVIEKISGLYSEHIDKHEVVSMFFMIPAISVYVFALLDKRKTFYGGTMSYKQGFISGLIITALVTLISPLTQYITTVFIGPEYFSNVIVYVVEQGKMTQTEAEAYFNLKNYIIEGLIGAPIMGLMTTAIIAIFTRKKKSSPEV